MANFPSRTSPSDLGSPLAFGSSPAPARSKMPPSPLARSGDDQSGDVVLSREDATSVSEALQDALQLINQALGVTEGSAAAEDLDTDPADDSDHDYR